MPTSTKNITFSWSPSATQQQVETTFRPNSDELWYVDKVRMECDGAGSVGSNYWSAHIVIGDPQNEANRSAYDTLNLSQKARAGDISDTRPTSATGTLGDYLTNALKLYVLTDDDGNSTAATYYITVTMRRVM